MFRQFQIFGVTAQLAGSVKPEPALATTAVAGMVEVAGLTDGSHMTAADSDWIGGVRQGLLIGTAVLTLVIPPATLSLHHAAVQSAVNPVALAERAAPAPQAPRPLRQADFGSTQASDETKHLANWIVDSGDNQQRFFVLIDKKHTQVFLFNALGTLVSSTPVLIGAAKGDDSVAGIGKRPIAEVAPHERTTPAGRFEAERGRNASGEDVIWVDYDAAVSMHRVRAIEPAERRLERLASPGTEDNRISYGCINVPVRFFENVIQPAFAAGQGLVYVMPEVKALNDVFTALYDPESRPVRQLASSR